MIKTVCSGDKTAPLEKVSLFESFRSGHGTCRATFLVAVLAVACIKGCLATSEITVVSAQRPPDEIVIIRPRIGFPAFLKLGDELTVEIKAPVPDGPCEIALMNEFSSHNLSASSMARVTATGIVAYALSTRNVPSGLYTLKITYPATSSRMTFMKTEPNCVALRESYDPPLRVFWVSDVHINTSPERIQNFRGIVRLANFLDLDLFIITGDVVDNPKEEYYELARQLVSDLNMPAILVGGNHDHATEGNFFEKYLAPWNGSVNIGAIHIATLDTGSGSIDGVLNENQLDWLEKDLSKHEAYRLKVVMFHHPMFNTADPKNETVEKVYGICMRHKVNLVLNGHMHRDIVFKGPILTLVNPNGYPGGTPYTGIRLLNVTYERIGWQYAGSEKPIPLYDFKISFSQPNDGLNLGLVAVLENGWKVPIDGVLRLRVGRGQKLNVEGAAIDNAVYLEKYLVLFLKIHLDIQGRRQVVVYTAPDENPPVVKLSTPPIVRVGAMITIVEFTWEASDQVLGLRKVEMQYSPDNTTWTTADLAEIRPRTFFGSIQLEKSVSRVFFYATALNIGNRKTSTRVGSLTLVEEKTTGAPAQVPWTLMVAALASLAILTFVMRLRKAPARTNSNTDC